MLLRRVSILAALMLVLGGTAAYAVPDPLLNQTVAQRPGGQRERGGPRSGGARLMEELNLSTDQRQEIEEIRNEYQDRLQGRGQELRQAQEQLRELMLSIASDGDLRGQHNRILDLRQDMAELHFEQMLEIRGVLTDEQRREFLQLMQERRQQMRDRNGRGNGRGNDLGNGNSRNNGRGNRRGNQPGSNDGNFDN